MNKLLKTNLNKSNCNSTSNSKYHKYSDLILIFGLALTLVEVTPSLAYASRPVRGTYEVPVQNTELTSFASYPVKFKADNYQDVPTQIDFPLPEALVGETKIIQMSKSTENANVWTGENVLGVCSTIDRYFTCNVKFNNLNIDPNKVDAAVQSTYSTPNEVNNRIQVARIFDGEPIGILRYKLRGRDRSNK